jgi:hypothetical protein
MDRFTWAVVGAVLGLVVVGVVAASILRSREAPPNLNTPGGVVLAYALAQQRRDGQAAWDLLAPSVQARSDRQRFLARFGERGSGREFLTIEGEKITADTASVVLVRTYPGSGGIFASSSSYANRTNVLLARELDGWRITVPPDEYLLVDRKP